jgi:glycosyltransferase involved in cell wall biosynthesis
MERVTILMPMRNGARFLSTSINSIQAQTFRGWRLIAIDDGSTDTSAAIVRKHQNLDSRIELWDFRYKGFAHALNQALAITKTNLVVRMDCDDIMLPKRLDQQLHFMKTNQGLAVAGSYVHYINEAGDRVGKGTSRLTSDIALKECLSSGELIGFHHSTAIFRRDAILNVGGYPTGAWPVEDVALWTHLAEQGQRICIQPEYLLEYRIHRSGSRTFERLEKVEWLKNNIMRRAVGSLDLTWDQYQHEIQARNLLSKLPYYRKLFAKACYKNAACDFANGHLIRGTALLASSVMLKPFYAAKQLSSKRPNLFH